MYSDGDGNIVPVYATGSANAWPVSPTVEYPVSTIFLSSTIATVVDVDTGIAVTNDGAVGQDKVSPLEFGSEGVSGAL